MNKTVVTDNEFSRPISHTNNIKMERDMMATHTLGFYVAGLYDNRSSS